jgi:hypothetical protein
MKLKSLLLIVISVMAGSGLFAQAMSGTYYVGGTGANFTTPKQALDTVSARGVSGNVIFRVRPGTYTGQLLINNITTTAANRTITFIADSINAAPVIITSNSSNSTMNFTVRLNNARFFNFKHIRFTTASTSYSRVIEIYGSTKRCEFDSCQFIGYKVSTTSNNYATIYNNTGTGNMSDSNTFKNSLIQNGSYAIYYYGGSSSNYEKGNTFLNNKIENFYYYGFYSYYQEGLTFKYNVIEDDSSTGYFYGAYLYYNRGIQFTHNKLDGSKQWGNYALFLYYCQGTSSLKNYVNNNMVSVRGGSTNYTNYGAYLYYCAYTEFNFNSIHLLSGYSSSYVLYFYGPSTTYSNNTMYNNSFVNGNMSAANPFYIYAPSSTILSSNRNNYYSTSGTLGSYNGTNCTSIAQWRSAANPNEANSISSDPGYYAVNDLHASEIDLFRTGQPVSGITTDFDNQARHSTAPCIGADEFTVPTIDARSFDVNLKFICQGQHTVIATIKNQGLDSLSKVRVNWALSTNNGAWVSQTPVNYTPTSKLPTSATAQVTLGLQTFLSGNTYKLKIYVDSVNNGTDGNPLNDTLVQDIKISLSGSFTVGGTSPDYANIGAALSDLAAKGVCGPVVLNIRPGTYTSTSWNINTIQGTSKANTITFQTDTAMGGRARFENNSTCVNINQTSHLIFRNLSFVQTGFSQVVNFMGLVNEITFDSCYLEGTKTSSTSSTYSIFNDNSGANNLTQRLRIYNCDINHASYMIYKYGVSTTSKEVGFEFVNNRVRNINYMYLYIFYQDSIVIKNNTFSDTAVGQTNQYGLYMYYTDNIKELSQNQVHLNAASQGYGIYCYYCGNTGTNRTNFSNNSILISSFGGSGTTYGSYFYSANNFDFNYNTWRINSGNTSSRALFLAQGYGHTMRNNNIANFSSGYAIYSQYSSTNIITNSNYNNIYSSSSQFGYNRNQNVASLSAWKLVTAMDANSQSVDPVFEAAQSNVPTAQALDSTALPLSGFTLDINSRARNTTHPDIGAYEFDVIYFDASNRNAMRDTVCPNEDVTLYIKNQGYADLDSIQVEWFVSTNSGGFVQQPSVAINAGNLVKDDSILVNLGAYPFSLGNNYDVKFFTHSPNGHPDQNPDGDTTYHHVEVYNIPSVTLGTIPDFCETDAPYIMTQGNPSGGWFVGPGAFKSYFRPRVAGAGTHTLHYYWADANGCAGNDSSTVTVHPGPSISVPNFSNVCPNQPPFTLTGFSPAGGVLTGGPWLSGTTFNPANAVPGSNNWVMYKAVSSAGCADSVTKWIRLDSLPVVSISSLPSVCENGSPVSLYGGKPVGGYYAGQGVSGSYFDPSLVSGAGQHSVRYAYTDGNGCTDSTAANLTVEPKPAINLPATANGCPKVAVTISVNNPGKVYLWSTGDTSESITVKDPKVYQVTVTDPGTVNNCSNEGTVEVTFSEVCVGMSGSPAQAFKGKVYPNPGEGRFVLEAENIATGHYSIEITTMNGALLFNEEIEVDNSFLQYPLDLPFAPGSYLLRLKGDNGYYQTMISIH